VFWYQNKGNVLRVLMVMLTFGIASVKHAHTGKCHAMRMHAKHT